MIELPSGAEFRIDDNLVALFGIVAVFAVPVVGILAWLVRRVLVHRERMEMIRHGLAPDVKLSRAQRLDPASAGLLPGEPALLVLRKGIRLAFIGLALTIGLASIGWHDGELDPGPWLLGGLIPLFIGLSQIATAVLSDPQALAALLRAFGRGEPPPTYRSGPPPGAGSSGPYTYRPDDTEPLRRPGTPPRKP